MDKQFCTERVHFYDEDGFSVLGWCNEEVTTEYGVCAAHALTPDEMEQAMATCEHGLSASLCAGPFHYPADN